MQPNVARLIATVVTLLLIPYPVQAETIDAFMRENCASAVVADQYELDARDAVETGHVKQWQALMKKASDAWYRCSKETADMYTHDWAAFFHANDLWSASDDAADPWAIIACNDLNDLAYDTRYSDVRKIALKIKRMACASN